MLICVWIVVHTHVDTRTHRETDRQRPISSASCEPPLLPCCQTDSVITCSTVRADIACAVLLRAFPADFAERYMPVPSCSAPFSLRTTVLSGLLCTVPHSSGGSRSGIPKHPRVVLLCSTAAYAQIHAHSVYVCASVPFVYEVINTHVFGWQKPDQ